ncbi:MAG: hypothetical protein KY451_12085 [Actinobacteria bacterium]|nr:hypothetical protein [Actinomycetota bacterium]MBW3648632.1 hypothetical protein [Actinomycetota bacterium]
MTTIAQSVISGVPCPVSAVHDHDPHLLEDFLGDTVFTVSMAGYPYVVRGCGSRVEDRVRFHEKDDMVGRDIRVWHVTPAAEGFQAEHIAAF